MKVKLQIFGLCIVMISLPVASIVLLLNTFGLYGTSHYYLAHFLLFLCLPFAFCLIGQDRLCFQIGILVGGVFHFGYELFEDQVGRATYSPDWDQVIAGGLGLLLSYVIFNYCERRIMLHTINSMEPMKKEYSF